MQKRILLPATFSLLSLVLSQGVAAAEPEANLMQSLMQRSSELSRAYESYERQLVELQSQYGPFDQNLLEPLDSMIQLMIEAGDYRQVAELQERKLQLVRTTMGFEHPLVVEALEDIILNLMRMNEWEEISDSLDHIRSVVDNNDDFTTEQLLNVIDDQAYWYLTRVKLERSSLRSDNFMSARELYQEAEELAEDHYGEDISAFYQWSYKRALSEYQLVKFLNADGGVSSDTIDNIIDQEGDSKLRAMNRFGISSNSFYSSGINIPVVNGDEEVGEYYIRDGLNIVGGIRDHAEEQGEIEAQALAKIYRADFQLLLGMGTAYKEYRDAADLLLATGISRQDIEGFFNRPALIPTPIFFTRFDDLVAYQATQRSKVAVDHDALMHVGEFAAWNESLPAIRVPFKEGSFLNIDFESKQVDLSFSINSRGRVSSVEVLTATPDDKRTRNEASRAVRELQFRPAIVDGDSERLRDVQIRYLFNEN